MPNKKKYTFNIHNIYYINICKISHLIISAAFFKKQNLELKKKNKSPLQNANDKTLPFSGKFWGVIIGTIQ